MKVLKSECWDCGELRPLRWHQVGDGEEAYLCDSCSQNYPGVQQESTYEVDDPQV